MNIISNNPIRLCQRSREFLQWIFYSNNLLDHWIEHLCTTKIRTNYFHDYLLIFQKLINFNGQLTRLPSIDIRSILMKLPFEQKFSYVNQQIECYSIVYKNRLSTLIHDCNQMQINHLTRQILAEFLYALERIQFELQTRSITSSDSNSIVKHENLSMRVLFFKYFRLFQTMYLNPDVNVKDLQFESMFRRIWIYWKEPMKIFLRQCQEKNLTLKSRCRAIIYRNLNVYPTDIRALPVHSQLKQFLSFDNQLFFV